MAKNLRTGLRQSIKASGKAGVTGGGIFSLAPLDLRFALQKTLDPRVTFTRASTGTYVGSDGVLRSAVTNLVLRSEEFNDAGWGGAVPIITANVATAPNGTTTADRITGSGVSAAQSKTSNTLAAGQGSVAVSVYAKYESHKWLQLFFNGDGGPFANYDIETGVVGSTGTNTTATITPVGDGWYRCVCVKTAGNATDVTGCRILLVDAGNSSRNANSATAASLLLWGAQLEQSATVGEYIPTTSVINSAPRFDHNPTTGESLGLLVEEARTNNLLQSEDFSSTWTNSNIAVTTNSVVAPDGTTTADTIAPPADGLTVTRFLRQNPILTTQQAYTLSVFAKVGTATTNGINLYVSDSTATNSFRANFNLFTLAASAGSTGWAAPTATIVPYPNGWYRCILTGVTSTVHVSLRAQIYLNVFGNTPDTYGSIHVWGAQLEAGAFATSYIPTTTATVTRAADVASIGSSAFTSFYNQAAQTWYGEYAPIYNASATVPANTLHLLQVYNTAVSTNNYAIRGANNSVNQEFVARNPTAGAQFINNAGIGFGVAGTNRKVSFGIDSSTLNISTNGTINSAANNAAALMATHDILSIGSGTGGTPPHQLNGTIKRLTFWPTRLSNTTLQQITQP